ncbi:metalloregulator ArsR/SmtB family transcription factor [Ahrensia marina]|uniref:ArsR/SmtB family transcription factor n=1 Tax=Ahrensia marina TaxID=1514904 RepID=UPI0035CFF324
MSQLDDTFAALADPTRRAILARLAEGKATVSEIMEPFDISQPAISRHLKVLEKAGLISTKVSGTARPRTLEVAPLEELDDWLSAYRERWEAQFQRLDTVLETLKNSQN